VSAGAVTFWDDKAGQHRVGLLAKTGDKWAHIVVFETTGLRVVKVPADDEADIFTYHDMKPLKETLSKYQGYADKFGATAEARRMLDVVWGEVKAAEYLAEFRRESRKAARS